MSQALMGKVIKRYINSDAYSENKHTSEKKVKLIKSACSEFQSLNDVISHIVNPLDTPHSLFISKWLYFGPIIPKSIHALLAFFFAKEFPEKAISSSNRSFNFTEFINYLRSHQYGNIAGALKPSYFNHIFVNQEKNTLSFSKNFMDESFELTLVQEESSKPCFDDQTCDYDILSNKNPGNLAVVDSESQENINEDFSFSKTLVIEETQNIREVLNDFISKKTNISSLEKLEIHNTNLTDNDLKFISIHFPNLTKLKIAMCRRITDEGMAHLSKLTSLTYLNLLHCLLITDTGLERIKGLIHLTYLNLSLCKRITDVGLGHIKHLIHLTYLNLMGCERITDVGLERIKGLIHLTYLNLSWCWLITDLSLEYVKYLIHLTYLDVLMCRQLTNDSLENISYLIPGISIVS